MRWDAMPGGSADAEKHWPSAKSTQNLRTGGPKLGSSASKLLLTLPTQRQRCQFECEIQTRDVLLTFSAYSISTGTMKMPWFRRFLPLLLLLLLLHVFAVESLSQPKDATESTGVSQPVPPHRGGGPNSYGGTQETQPGNERVQSAWTSLRESKIAFPRPHKPSSLVGYAWLYAKEAFRVLFLNAPISDAHGRRIHPTLTGPVRELNIAAKEDRNPDAMFLLAEMNFHGNFTHPRNFKVASEWYQELASLTGNNTAQYMLGLMYATGIGGAVERDQAKALMYHTFAAEAGNTRSEMTLAYRSHIGIGTPRDCDQATHYYKRVADKAMEYYRSGLPGGRTMDRELYRWADDEGGVYGEGASMSSSKIYVNRDVHSSAEASLDDVLEYLDLMARKGELRPTFNLAKMHYDGARNMPRNYRKAMKYFRLVTKRYWNKDGSVNPNHPRGIGKMASRAAGHIGLMYLRGEGVEQNFGTALTWFKRGLANGDPLCQHEIGLMYLEGYGVLQDAVRASSYFKAAADQDFPASQTRLGALFLDQGDVAAAARYFDLAARYAWVEAFYYLAEIANYGIGRHRHCGMAAAYYKMVAERAEAIHTSFPEANAAYENGDLESALIASTMAAEQGYENAQSNVAYLLDEQRSVLSLDSVLSFGEKTRPSLLRNAALALIYWTRSSKQANIDSLIKMGDYYLSGFGASPDAEKASLCYHTAAEAYHSSQAYWNLGWMHENGVSVDRDFHMAKRYYDLALETNEVAYLPVKLALLKLRARAWWDRITYGKVNPIQEEREPVPNRSFREWMAAFIKNDEEEEARYRAQLFNQRGEFEDDEVLAASTDPHLENHHDDGYYDDLELDIDESFLEGLIIVALAATLLVLVYLRQQRNRRRENENNAAAGAGGVNPGNPGNGDIDRGFFPRPGEPEFAQWVAGGIGH